MQIDAACNISISYKHIWRGFLDLDSFLVMVSEPATIKQHYLFWETPTSALMSLLSWSRLRTHLNKIAVRTSLSICVMQLNYRRRAPTNKLKIPASYQRFEVGTVEWQFTIPKLSFTNVLQDKNATLVHYALRNVRWHTYSLMQITIQKWR